MLGCCQYMKQFEQGKKPHDVSFSRVSHLDCLCLLAFEAVTSSDHFLPELVRPMKISCVMCHLRVIESGKKREKLTP